MFSISTDILKAVAVCVSTEETRYFLNGVWIEPAETGVLLVATDGHRMAVFHDVKGTAPRSAIVSLPFKSLKARGVLKFDLPDKPGRTVGEVVEDRGKHPMSLGHVVVGEIDGKYPDWRRILPKKAGKAVPAFNGLYISDLASAVKRFGSRQAMLVSAATDDDPAVVTFSDVDFGFYVLMPMRANLVRRNRPYPLADELLAPRPIAA